MLHDDQSEMMLTETRTAFPLKNTRCEFADAAQSAADLFIIPSEGGGYLTFWRHDT